MKRLNYNKKNKIMLILFIVIFILNSGLFAFMSVNCISLYSKFNIEYSELTYKELTFDKYIKVRLHKDYTYEIYFKEFEKPFNISNIADRKLDVASLKKLVQGDMIKVYYRQNSNKKYDYEIYEFAHGSITLLSLSDYIETNQKNQILGMILCPIFCLSSLFLIYVFIRSLKVLNYNAENKELSDKSLGKIKIEYKINGNVIRVYNYIFIYSLVINDKIVDQYCGIWPYNMHLKGKLQVEDEVAIIETRIERYNIVLYYNCYQVAKKFMGFL